MNVGDEQKRIEALVSKMVEERGWEKYHTPAQLVPALLVECSELMQGCLWHSSDEIDNKFKTHDPYLVKELADIAINYYSIIRYCGLSVSDIVEAKVKEVLVRYSTLEKGEHR